MAFQLHRRTFLPKKLLESSEEHKLSIFFFFLPRLPECILAMHVSLKFLQQTPHFWTEFEEKVFFFNSSSNSTWNSFDLRLLARTLVLTVLLRMIRVHAYTHILSKRFAPGPSWMVCCNHAPTLQSARSRTFHESSALLRERDRETERIPREERSLYSQFTTPMRERLSEWERHV